MVSLMHCNDSDENRQVVVMRFVMLQGRERKKGPFQSWCEREQERKKAQAQCGTVVAFDYNSPTHATHQPLPTQESFLFTGNK